MSSNIFHHRPVVCVPALILFVKDVANIPFNINAFLRAVYLVDQIELLEISPIRFIAFREELSRVGTVDIELCMQQENPVRVNILSWTKAPHECRFPNLVESFNHILVPPTEHPVLLAVS